MALTNINPVMPDSKGPSALENAAKVLGIGISLGDLGLKAANLSMLSPGSNNLNLGSPVQAAGAMPPNPSQPSLMKPGSMNFGPSNPYSSNGGY